MSELISGKDALIALANGEEVQIESNRQWVSVDNCQVYQFLRVVCDDQNPMPIQIPYMGI